MERQHIQEMIYTVRDKQVMLDSDLARLYQVETKVLNQAVKRNIQRFPERFRFQLTDSEKYELVTNCDRFNTLKHSSSNPYAFTEQGIAMLSAVLKSDIAVEVSIKIMDSFIEMRKFLLSNRELFSRLDRVELKQLVTDKKLEEIFNYLSSQAEVKQNIFFNGQIYDAFKFIVDLIKKAKKEIILIDNYVNLDTLNLLCKKNDGVHIIIVGAEKKKPSDNDIEKFNAQYPKLTFKHTSDFHDRFLILDAKCVYHIGSSIKDAGKKTFGMSKIEDESLITALRKKLFTITQEGTIDE